MRIAQVAPLFESTPPKFYGGTERVVSYLTEELVRLGHEVTLFASGDSITSAELVPACPRSLRLYPDGVDPVVYHILLLEQVAKRAAEFDVIHFHIEYVHHPIARRLLTPSLSTQHGRMDLPYLAPLFQQYREAPVVSISESQRKPLPWLNWIGTVYHGLPEHLYTFNPKPEKYLAFLGRICPEKGVDRAIEIAKRVGMPIKIAAKIDEKDQAYFHNKIKPLFQQEHVEYIGEITNGNKDRFLGGATALLFPIDWPEPFGLVMIESLAAGTPVIAFNNGSVPEVVDHGETGFIVNSIDEAVEAVHKIDTIDRYHCRDVFERRFTVHRMAEGYLQLYRQLMMQEMTRSPH